MPVITISREHGSEGRVVARLVAERLGYRFVWRDMINEAARRANSPEVALATIDDLDLLGLAPSLKSRRAYCEAVQQVMEELAHADNVVILGRAGQIVLKNTSAIHVRVIAPVDIRVQRIAQQQNITLSAAEAQVKASDYNRKTYLQRFYHVKWDDPDLYDLVINTARIPPGEAADIIIDVVHLRSSALKDSEVARGENH